MSDQIPPPSLEVARARAVDALLRLDEKRIRAVSASATTDRRMMEIAERRAALRVIDGGKR